MRAGIILLVYMLVFTLGVDWLCYQQLKKYITIKKKGLYLLFAHWFLFLAFAIGFIIFFIQNASFITEQQYFVFTLLNGLYLLFYVPKIVYLLFLGVSKLIEKIVFDRKKYRNDPTIRKDEARKMTRSAFLGKVGLAVAGAPFLSLIYGMAKGRFKFHVKEVPLYIDRLPDAFEGFKMVQISDIHLGNFNQEYHRLHEVTTLINAENPDVIFMTGDLVNNFATETSGWDTVFSKMKASYGKFSILGNHDYGDYSRWHSQYEKRRNFEGIVGAHNRFGFHLLRNESVEIKKDSAKISLIGVENWGRPPFPQYGDLHKSMQNVNAQDVKILLSHDPDHWSEEVVGNTDIDLTLAGHTHGMQLGVKFRNSTWSPAKWKYKHWDGMYSEGKQHLYVNRGLGFIGIPMRVGMPPEITSFTLHKS